MTVIVQCLVAAQHSSDDVFASVATVVCEFVAELVSEYSAFDLTEIVDEERLVVSSQLLVGCEQCDLQGASAGSDWDVSRDYSSAFDAMAVVSREGPWEVFWVSEVSAWFAS